MIKNLLLKSSQFIVSGMMMGSLLSVPTWAMEEIPEEVLERTFTYLPLKTLASIAPVSKHWLTISEKEELWQRHGFSSKKKCLEFPYPTLEQQHLKILFKDGYLSGNEIFFWKPLETIEKPCEIISRIAPEAFPKPVNPEWTAHDIICVKKDSNLMQYTTNFSFIIEAMKARHCFEPVPYTFTLKGSWSLEDRMEVETHK